ncbi:hypothetical protein BBO99_00002807 [Phytophthora kernoviae]|uniref:RRM domain-containing protein n=2 Tax=Phytophthora kernoviae TaxID=325452 RepID=A0A3R7KWJ4_9STRA|nr:hypothetical protein G195_003281 [Phytophthora kernoviae 00238/432]KAG2524621.1 hypothetical protein JM16_002199 [Phytophthora kernoviae]KAG2527873.1 hypothetical protein JM18_003508 [Phytophthora kernoviae]RLN44043.1 hypothetical protein BBI17_002717 [Phytophthora kernoviae]RLN82585.1 hypothetical protein BBO99_00002807 [Phytophthora kernoviae]
MNVVAEIQRLNERELELGVTASASWHHKYRESAWLFIGGLSFELSEGDVLCVMSQFGEIEDIHLVRDAKTGKSKGFAFIKYENQRSTVLAVDNLNGFRLLDRVLRVDHVLKYRLPKELQEDSDDSDEEEKERKPRGLPGHAYEGKELASEFDIQKGVDVFKAPEETHKEKKKRKREEKKKRKTVRKMQKIEKKQQKLMEQEDKETVQSSATGWRGRLEPSAPRPRRNERQQEDAREKQQNKSYGGMSRIR